MHFRIIIEVRDEEGNVWAKAAYVEAEALDRGTSAVCNDIATTLS